MYVYLALLKTKTNENFIIIKFTIQFFLLFTPYLVIYTTSNVTSNAGHSVKICCKTRLNLNSKFFIHEQIMLMLRAYCESDDTDHSL